MVPFLRQIAILNEKSGISMPYLQQFLAPKETTCFIDDFNKLAWWSIDDADEHSGISLPCLQQFIASLVHNNCNTLNIWQFTVYNDYNEWLQLFYWDVSGIWHTLSYSRYTLQLYSSLITFLDYDMYMTDIIILRLRSEIIGEISEIYTSKKYN